MLIQWGNQRSTFCSQGSQKTWKSDLTFHESSHGFLKISWKMRGNLENENFTCCQYTFLAFFNVSEWCCGKIHSLDLNQCKLEIWEGFSQEQN